MKSVLVNRLKVKLHDTLVLRKQKGLDGTVADAVRGEGADDHKYYLDGNLSQNGPETNLEGWQSYPSDFSANLHNRSFYLVGVLAILGIPYKVTKVTVALPHYSLTTAYLDRDDGTAGWIQIVGPGAQELLLDHRYVITECTEGPSLEERVAVLEKHMLDGAKTGRAQSFTH